MRPGGPTYRVDHLRVKRVCDIQYCLLVHVWQNTVVVVWGKGVPQCCESATYTARPPSPWSAAPSLPDLHPVPMHHLPLRSPPDRLARPAPIP